MRTASIRAGVLGALVAILAGCGGAQSTVPQATAGQDRAQQSSGSWILPEAMSEDLLYVSSHDKVTIYAYPSDKIVGKLTGFSYAIGLCSDRNGDVWVTDDRSLQISEYAHAGTEPIAVLSDQDNPVGCAVDPSSGNLAAVNYHDNAFVYPHASGAPTIYTDTGFYDMQFCAYDANGNLYIDGDRHTDQGLAPPGMLWLSVSGTRLQRFKLEGRHRHGLRSPGGLQWDGKNVVIGYTGESRNELYRFSGVGPIGKITKRFTLNDGGSIGADAPFLVYRDSLIGTYSVGSNAYYIAWWPYPAGGPVVKQFKVTARFYPAGLAVSVAQRL
jgi:hypothetical protein